MKLPFAPLSLSHRITVSEGKHKKRKSKKPPPNQTKQNNLFFFFSTQHSTEQPKREECSPKRMDSKETQGCKASPKPLELSLTSPKKVSLQKNLLFIYLFYYKIKLPSLPLLPFFYSRFFFNSKRGMFSSRSFFLNFYRTDLQLFYFIFNFFCLSLLD